MIINNISERFQDDCAQRVDFKKIGDFLEEIYRHFGVKLGRFFKEIGAPACLVPRRIVKDESCYDPLQEFLSGNYEPPVCPLRLFIHLAYIRVIYQSGALKGVPYEASQRIQASALRLTARATDVTTALSTKVKDAGRIKKIKKTKSAKKSKTRADILEGFKLLGAKWHDDNSNKPIMIDSTRYSLNRVATAKLPMQLADDFDPRTIINHLKELKKDGKI